MDLLADRWLLQLNALAPLVGAVRLTNGDADQVGSVADIDSIPLDNQADDAKALLPARKRQGLGDSRLGQVNEDQAAHVLHDQGAAAVRQGKVHWPAGEDHLLAC